jgi:hypothetical protein
MRRVFERKNANPIKGMPRRKRKRCPVCDKCVKKATHLNEDMLTTYYCQNIQCRRFGFLTVIN